MWKLSLLLITASAATVSAIAVAQETPAFLQRMAGTWEVRQRMWPGPGSAAADLPSAIARRVLMGGKYLEESMEPSSSEAAAFFRRNAFLNYNPVTKRYEYTSLDTRAPQLMMETSSPAEPQRLSGAELKLQGGIFVAPEWGSVKNVPFRYRLSIGEVEHDKQTIRLYFTPQSVLPKKEFLAFEYVYTRRP